MDPELWFPAKNDVTSANEAIETCFGCPVRKQCSAHKDTTRSTYGIWAGEQSKRGAAL